MDIIQALVIAILQGATELFPVSSLGHAVVLPALLHWGINQRSPEFLPFLVMLHLGTAVALLVRPDGYVVCADPAGLPAALRRWFGEPVH